MRAALTTARSPPRMVPRHAWLCAPPMFCASRMASGSLFRSTTRYRWIPPLARPIFFRSPNQFPGRNPHNRQGYSGYSRRLTHFRLKRLFCSGEPRRLPPVRPGAANRRKAASMKIYNGCITGRTKQTPSGSRQISMSMKTKAAILVTSFAVLLFVVVGSLGGVHASSSDGSYRQLQVYSEVLSRVRSEYVEEPNIPKVTDGALHGLVESLDSNSSYMTADAYKAFKAHKSESKEGIGAVISKRFGYAAVVDVLPGSPAEKAGVEQTDIFESIEGKSTRDMSLPEIRSLLVGVPGSTLNVAVVRARKAEPQKMVITRDIVSIPAVADRMMDDGIGYIKVDALTKGKAAEVAGKVKSLEKSGAKKLLLDLSKDAGGCV